MLMMWLLISQQQWFLAMDCKESELINLQSSLSSKTMRIYRSEDRVGVGLGSCLKNVYAIATGLSDGLGLGDNARAALLTRSMNEMINLGISLGGESETFFGLSGFGDLIGTCIGEWSRNRNFGLALAKGGTPKEIIGKQKNCCRGLLGNGLFFSKNVIIRVWKCQSFEKFMEFFTKGKTHLLLCLI